MLFHLHTHTFGFSIETQIPILVSSLINTHFVFLFQRKNQWTCFLTKKKIIFTNNCSNSRPRYTISIKNFSYFYSSTSKSKQHSQCTTVSNLCPNSSSSSIRIRVLILELKTEQVRNKKGTRTPDFYPVVFVYAPLIHIELRRMGKFTKASISHQNQFLYSLLTPRHRRLKSSDLP